MNESEVLLRQEGKAGVITLNRPQALNALTHQMVLAVEEAMRAWVDTPAVELVLIEGVGERAFCAGADIGHVYEFGLKGEFDRSETFWRDEYRLNALIADYPKPYVAFMHGFVLGGGVGMSSHGSHRIVCETSKVAMPECAIGLIPDVGGSHLLGQAPGYMGEFLGLTGYRMNAADAIVAGFGDVFVPLDLFDDLKKALIETGDVGQIDNFQKSPGDSFLKNNLDELNRIFETDDVGKIIDALTASQQEWAKTALENISSASPLSVLCTLKLVGMARLSNNLDKALENELRFTARASAKGDLLEGVRAAIIDKDRRPKWMHDSLSKVPKKLVEEMLAPL